MPFDAQANIVRGGALALALVGVLFGVAPGRAAPLRLSGWVVGADGRPAAARLELSAVDDSYSAALARWSGQGERAAVAAITTAADGSYELVVPEPGSWRLTLLAPGVPALELALDGLVASRGVPAVRLPAPGEHDVRVVDAGGRPLAGAWVEALVTLPATPTTADAYWLPRPTLVRTGADGVARVATGPLPTALWAWAPGQLVARREAALLAAVTTLDLAPAGERTVVARDAAGRRLPGVVAVASDVARLGGSWLPWPLAASDAEGRLTLPVDPRGSTAVDLLAADGLRAALILAPAGPEGPAGERAPEDVTLTPPDVVRGQVLLAADQTPVGGALAWCRHAPGTIARSAGDGAFELDCPREHPFAAHLLANPEIPRAGAPPFLVTARADGYRQALGRLSHAGEGRPVIWLEPAVPLVGRVMDARGAPVAGARIDLVADTGERGFAGHHVGRVEADARGGFRFAALPPPAAIRLDVDAPGLAPSRVERPAGWLQEADAAGELPLVVTLSAGVGLVGRLADAGGPVTGAALSVRRLGDAGDLWRAWRPADAEATSDAEGRFELANLATGPHRLQVRASGRAPRELAVEAPEVGIGDLGTIELEPAVELVAEVVDAAGDPIAGARVRFGPPGKSFGFDATVFPQGVLDAADRGEVECGGDGRCRLGDLAPGQRLSVRVMASGFAPADLPLVVAPGLDPVADESAGAPLRVVLRRTARLAGRVIDERGDGVADVRVILREAIEVGVSPRIPSVAVTDAEGHFELRDLSPRPRLELTASAPGYPTSLPRGIDLSMGDVDGVEIVLEPGGRLLGTLRTTGGEPLVGARVGLQSRDGNSLEMAESDAVGAFVTGPLRPGRYSLGVQAAGRARSSREVEIGRGDRTIELVIEDGVTVRGRVVDATGAPLPAAWVEVRQSGASARAQVDSAGGFELVGLVAGGSRLAAGAPGLGEVRRELAVPPTGIRNLEIVVGGGTAMIRGSVRGLIPEEQGQVLVRAWGPGEADALVAADGSFELTRLEAGRWQVTAYGVGRQAQAGVELGEGELADVELVFPESQSPIEGRVLFAGQPLAGVVLTTVNPHFDVALTDRDGRFRLARLEPGRAQLRVSHPELGLDQTVETMSVAGSELLLAFEPGRLVGTVRHLHTGAPLQAIVLATCGARRSAAVAVPGDEGHGQFLVTATADAVGRFDLGPAPGGVCEVVAALSGYRRATVEVAVQSGSRQEIELALEPRPPEPGGPTPAPP